MGPEYLRCFHDLDHVVGEADESFPRLVADISHGRTGEGIPGSRRDADGTVLLTGFPGETEADYLEQAELIPFLHHLQPPSASGELRLDRFSPYFDRPPPTFSDIAPFRAYSLVYPAGDVDLRKIAYYFSHTNLEPVSDEAQQALRQAMEQWRDRWRGQDPPRLYYQRGPGFVQVVDERGTRAYPTALRRLACRCLPPLWRRTPDPGRTGPRAGRRVRQRRADERTG